MYSEKRSAAVLYQLQVLYLIALSDSRAILLAQDIRARVIGAKIVCCQMWQDGGDSALRGGIVQPAPSALLHAGLKVAIIQGRIGRALLGFV